MTITFSRTAQRTAGALAAVTAAVLMTAAPAQADGDDDFISALSNAGMSTSDPGMTAALGESICPALVKPGSSFAEAAATARNGGVPPQLAGFFAGLAIQHYCPQMMTSIGDGTIINQLSGLQGLTGIIGG
ncbi:MAG: DUF732 domain-containing protein [Mycobacterium sp.]|nr:DUF732 domain-containing protein [Mycobacterium sp.]